jgi:hypothetical protein
MITNSTQKWETGNSVKVGFLTLTVVRIEPTPGDHMPDRYHLIDSKSLRRYVFTPHVGLERFDR